MYNFHAVGPFKHSSHCSTSTDLSARKFNAATGRAGDSEIRCTTAVQQPSNFQPHQFPGSSDAAAIFKAGCKAAQGLCPEPPSNSCSFPATIRRSLPARTASTGWISGSAGELSDAVGLPTAIQSISHATDAGRHVDAAAGSDLWDAGLSARRLSFLRPATGEHFARKIACCCPYASESPARQQCSENRMLQ